MNVVVTGASRGLGRSIAETFAARGGEIAVAARTQTELDDLEDDFAKRFPDARLLAFRTDLSQKQGVFAFAEAIKHRWNSVDVLVNNVGIFRPGKLLDDPEGFLENIMDINFWPAYHLTRALAPVMVKAGKGHIFNIGSVASRDAYPDSGAYSISKFALLGFSKSLRMELRESGIKVTDVLPGSTWTSSWKDTKIDPRRLLDADEVARAIYHAWEMGPSGFVEELVLRPQLGDL